MISIPPMVILVFLLLFIFAFPPSLTIYWTYKRPDDGNLLLLILIVAILIIPVALMVFWWFYAVWIAKRFFRPYHRMEVRTRRRDGGREELGVAVEMKPLNRTREFVEGLRVVEREGEGKGKETSKKDKGKGKAKA